MIREKSCGAVQSLGALIESDKEEIEYLESVSESLERSKTLADIAEIREELSLGGYIKFANKKQKRKKQQPQLTEYKSAEGYRILVGKNNMQNDYVTLRLANSSDLWFHTKSFAGSHTVIKLGVNKEIPDRTILEAASLAAFYSSAKNSLKVEVDYTQIKNVKKPSGAKPGMVIYTTNKTVFVNPREKETSV